MNRDQMLALLSQVDPRIAEAYINGEIPIEELLKYLDSSDMPGFDITRIQISDDRYFENARTEIIDEEDRLGTITTYNVWDCGHSQKYFEMGGVCSFGHVVCVQCIRYCDIGRHLCCVMDSKILSNGLIVCDCHRGIHRFSNRKFNKFRVR